MQKSLIFIVLFIVIITLFSGCTSEKQQEYISFSEVVPKNAVGIEEIESDALRVSLATINSTKESITYYEDLLDLLSKKIGRPVKLVQRNTYAEVNELLRTGGIDLGFVCTYSYVVGNDRFGLELVAVPENDGLITYNSYIIVPKESGIESFLQLKGKTFVFTDPMSTTGYLYPLQEVRLLNSTPEKFFAEYIFTYSHDKSIYAVLEGIADGAAVDSMIYDSMVETNPEIGEQLKIIQVSEDYSAPPVVMRPNINVELKKELKEFFLQLDTTEKGSAILNKMGLDSYRPIQDAAYDSVRSLGMVVEE